jgi:UPF0176 protein
MNYKVLLFYKYTKIENPNELKEQQVQICKTLGLKGRTIIATEGINSTLGGTEQNINEYIKYMQRIEQFKDIDFKVSSGTGPNDFPKLSIKVRNEIVSTHMPDLDPTIVTGAYITADQLHNWFRTNKEFYLVDMRNTYEYKIGHFKNSIDSTFDNFRDLPKVLKKLEHLKEKTVVTVCTGGIRCEKASGYLVKNGFKDVYQLYGGMQTYMQKYPGDDFLGKLYVFDNRIAVDFITDESKRVVVGKCEICGQPSEVYVNCGLPQCNKHFICCENCSNNELGKSFCTPTCAKKYLFVNKI